MIIVTSAPPNSQNSIDAIKTWHSYGKVFSLNSEKEASKIDGYNDVTFVDTHKIMEWGGRPLVSINAFFDLAIEQDEDLLIINSDIHIKQLPEFKKDGITIMTRCDYSDTETIEQGRLYVHGFDAFNIPKKFLKMYPQYVYSMGNVWWDYVLPYTYMVKGVSVYWPQGKLIFHKMHDFQWNFEEWETLAEFFKLYFKIEKHISLEQMAINILSVIQNRSIK